MKKKAAILIDGGFVLKRLYLLMGRTCPEAEDVYRFAHACLGDDEEIFRIYFYDCPPYEENACNPLDPEHPINFAETSVAIRNRRPQQQLSLMPHVAFRKGELLLQGWRLSGKLQKEIISKHRPICKDDLSPELRQKRVDIKIGLDVAWLASKRIVDRIILVTGDTDFIPAMKFARGEGAQVVLITMGVKVKSSLRENTDLIRKGWPLRDDEA